MNKLWIDLVYLELLKLKRTASVFVLVAIPLFTCIVASLIFLSGRSLAQVSTADISMFWAGLQALWGYVIFPLFIALIASLINHIEHKNHTWRVMFSLPISKAALFWSKFLVLILYVVAANILLWFFANLFLIGVSLLNERTDIFFGVGLLGKLHYLLLAIFPIALFYHTIAWRFEQIILPLAISIIACAGVMYIGNSEYWIYYPWSYGLITLSATDPSHQIQALYLASTVSLLLSVFLVFRIEKLSSSE